MAIDKPICFVRSQRLASGDTSVSDGGLTKENKAYKSVPTASYLVVRCDYSSCFFKHASEVSLLVQNSVPAYGFPLE